MALCELCDVEAPPNPTRGDVPEFVPDAFTSAWGISVPPPYPRTVHSVSRSLSPRDTSSGLQQSQ